MILGVTLTLLCLFSYSFSNILESYESRMFFKNTVIFAFISKVFGIIVAMILLFWFSPRTNIPTNILLLIALGSIFEILYQIPYYKSLKIIDASAVASLFLLSRILIPILAFVFLGETLSLENYIGFGIIIFGCLVLTLRKHHLGFNRALYLMSIVAVILSLQDVIFKFSLNNISWFDYVFYGAIFDLFFAIFFMTTLFAWGEFFAKLKLIRKNSKLIFTNETCNTVGEYLYLLALDYLPLTVFKGILSLHPFFVFITNIFFSKFFPKIYKAEPHNITPFRFLISTIIIVIGIFMILDKIPV